MAKWSLELKISKELKGLQDFTQNMNDEAELGDDFVEIAKKLEDKFLSYESEIRKSTEDDGTFEALEWELDDFVMACDLKFANYSLENIYQICDCAGILLIQR